MAWLELTVISGSRAGMLLARAGVPMHATVQSGAQHAPQQGMMLFHDLSFYVMAAFHQLPRTGPSTCLRTAGASGGRFALHIRHWPRGVTLMKKGVCGSRAFSARLSPREASQRPIRVCGHGRHPFLEHSPRGSHFAAQRCMALPPPVFFRTFLYFFAF